MSKSGGGKKARTPSARPKREQATAKDASKRNQDTTPPDGSSVRRAWRTLTLRSKIFIGVVVAVLSGWSTIKDEAVIPVADAIANQQPGKDAKSLSGLQPGMLLSQFQERLGTGSVAVIKEHIAVPLGSGTVMVRDELFVLDTVYLEAFVDDDATVLAYTITARDEDMPKFRIASGTLEFGQTFAEDRPAMPIAGTSEVAAVCGAHIGAYWEISGTSNAALNRTLAVGSTSTGFLPPDEDAACPPSEVEELAPSTAAPAPEEGSLWRIDTYQATDEFLDAAGAYRGRVVINAVCVTASAVPLVPEMISLHPETALSFEPLEED